MGGQKGGQKPRTAGANKRRTQKATSQRLSASKCKINPEAAGNHACSQAATQTKPSARHGGRNITTIKAKWSLISWSRTDHYFRTTFNVSTGKQKAKAITQNTLWKLRPVPHAEGQPWIFVMNSENIKICEGAGIWKHAHMIAYVIGMCVTPSP